jgi:hypothetical protein
MEVGAGSVSRQRINGTTSQAKVIKIARDRIDRALSLVQKDLDKSGFGRYRMMVVDGTEDSEGVETYYAALPDGTYHGSPNSRIVGGPQLDDLSTLVDTATSVQDSLAEVERIAWPSCEQHDFRIVVPRRMGTSGCVGWYCEKGHYLSEIGKLE